MGCLRLTYHHNPELSIVSTEKELTFEKSSLNAHSSLELSNHLGNVLAAISDRKWYDDTQQEYNAYVKMKADYYPFGMIMPGRSFGIDEARHLFNGMEADAEVSGDGNSYTTEFRQYDPRLGRWKSLDPLMSIQPWSSPYVAFNNNPIYFIDPTGLIGGPANETTNYDIDVSPSGGDNTRSFEGGNDPVSYYENDKGFSAKLNPAKGEHFGDYMGNVEPNSGRHYQLTEINGEMYHKHEHNAAKQLANSLDETYDAWLGNNDEIGKVPYEVTNRKYSPSEESFNEMALFTAEFFISGLVINKVGAATLKLLRGAGNSIWKLGKFDRGFAYENLLGGNLVSNYPKIDKFVNGVATSIKTLDIGATTYVTNARTIYYRLTKYVDDLHNFKGVIHGGVNTTGGVIKKKVLEVGIPRGATKAQVEQINKAIEYAASKGIKMNVRVVK